MDDDEPVVTQNDLDALNRAALMHRAGLARIVGTVVATIGVIGLALGAWTIVRPQILVDETVGDAPFQFGQQDASLADRIDLLANSYSLLALAAFAAAVGFVLRLAADVVAVRSGASLTGVEVGDPLPGREVLGLDQWSR